MFFYTNSHGQTPPTLNKLAKGIMMQKENVTDVTPLSRNNDLKNICYLGMAGIAALA